MQEWSLDPDLDGSDSAAAVRAGFLERLLDGLASATTAADLLARAAPAIGEALGGCCAIWLADHIAGGLQLAGTFHPDPARQPDLQRLVGGWSPPDVRLSEGPPTTLVAANQEDAYRVFGSRARARLAQRVGLSFIRLIPLVYRTSPLGLLAVGRALPFHRAADEAALALSIGRWLGTALARVRQLEMTRQVSQQLALTTLRLQAVLESIPQGVILVDVPTGQIVFANQPFARIMGRSLDTSLASAAPAALMGLARAWGELYAPEDLPWVRAARTAAPTAPEEMTVRRSDGSEATVLSSAAPILDGEGRVVEVVAILQDISERREFEQQKDDFLAIAAHELRTPMTMISGYVQFFRWLQQKEESHLSERELGMLETIDQQVCRLKRLIVEMLDFARVQMGRLELAARLCDLGLLARESVVQMHLVAPDRDWSVQAQDDCLVEGDSERLRQVFGNLLANAAKATQPGGHVAVSVQRTGGTVRVAVRDDGVGLPAEVQGRVFERLYRVPGEAEAGLGLGLYISRGIVEAHGGRIWLESAEGQGATFFFELPAANAG